MVLLRSLVLLLALVVSGEELVGRGTLVLTSLTPQWSPDPFQISFHGGQGLGEGSQERTKI